MKTLVAILIMAFMNMLNAQDLDTVFDINADIPMIFVNSGDAYLNDSTLNAEYKVIHKFERSVENPLDDEFWPKTPTDLWENDVRYYLVTLNNNGEFNLFAVDKNSYEDTKKGDYFMFFVFRKFSATYGDLGKFNKDEILEFIK